MENVGNTKSNLSIKNTVKTYWRSPGTNAQILLCEWKELDWQCCLSTFGEEDSSEITQIHLFNLYNVKFDSMEVDMGWWAGTFLINFGHEFICCLYAASNVLKEKCYCPIIWCNAHCILFFWLETFSFNMYFISFFSNWSTQASYVRY